MTDLGTPALTALLLHAIAFLVLAVVVPLRRSGRPAAMVSILCAAGSFGRRNPGVADARKRQRFRVSYGSGCRRRDRRSPRLACWPTPIRRVMLTLVGLVSLLVQVYSLGYLSDEPRPLSAATTRTSRSSRSR